MSTKRLRTLLPIILLEILGLLIVVCLTRIPFYPLIHDTPNIHIIAQRILAGAAPYRDIIDMNMPGIYLIHMLIVSIPGNVDMVWFCFHFTWALLTALAAFFFLKSESRLTAWLAVVTVIAYYLTRKAFYYGQRDFLLLLPVLLGMQAFRRYIVSSPRKSVWLFLSGLAVGAAATIKPLPLLFAGLAGVWLLCNRSERAFAQKFLRIGLLAAGVLLPFAGMTIWLAVAGGLTSFLNLAPDLSSVYYHWQQLNWGDLIFFTTLEVRILVGMLVLAGVLTVVREKSLPRSPLYLFMYAGVGYGLVHYFSQAKGWEYHQLPFAIFAILLSSALLMRTATGKSTRQAVLAGLCLYLPLVGMLPRAAWIMLHDPSEYLDTFQPAVHKLEADYSRLDLDGKSIQILDMTTGGAYLLYTHQIPLATPILLDFELQPNPDDAYLTYRTDFLARVQARPPEVFIIAREFESDRDLSYARFSDWTAFTGWFESNYSLVSDQTEYEIFKLK